MKKVVTFRDYEMWSKVHEDTIVVTAAQQLEDFLNNNFYGKIVNIGYSITHEGSSSYGIPKYKNHILLVYEAD